MNFTPELLAFQGVIVSADNVNPFARICSRGGNEEKILNIVESIFKFLHEKQYITTEGIVEKAKSEMRKFCFYLVLNADFPELEEIVEMTSIGHVIWTTPTITKCLISEIAWALNMDSFIYEIISFSNPLLAVQVLSAFIESIKYYHPTNCLNKIKILCQACYRLICRLHFFNYENNVMSKILTDLCDNLLRCLNYFSEPPNAGKLDRLKADDLYRYQGHTLSTMINVVLDCLSRFESVEPFMQEGFDDMYLSTFNPEIIKTRSLVNKVCDIRDGPILECLQRSNITLLDKCKGLVMNVSVDVFCAWSEFEENGKSMQKAIGELCYVLHGKILGIPDISEHSLVNMLPQISCKVEDIFDVIKASDDNTLIANAQLNTENQVHWLGAIVEKDGLCQNHNFVKCLLENSQFIKSEHCAVLFNKVDAHLTGNASPDENLKQLAVNVFDRITNSEKEKTVAEHFRNKVFHNTLETATFESKITEVFNKLIDSTEANFIDIFTIFIQNPYKVYSKIVSTGTENMKQSTIMINVSKMLQIFSDHYYKNDTESCIIKAVVDFCGKKLETDKQQRSFVNLMAGLKSTTVISPVKLLLLIVMPSLHKALLNKDIAMLHTHVNVLKASYSIEELLPYRAPLLAMLAQVLEALRWKFAAFSGVSPCALEDTLQLQIALFRTYSSQIPEKEANWLKAKLRALQPINMFYYKDLWNPPGDNFIEIISGRTHLQPENLGLLMAKLLPCCTPREWTVAWDCLARYGDMMALELLYGALLLMSVAEADHRTEITKLCLRYCYRNFVFVVKNCVLKEPLNEEILQDVIEKIIELANRATENDIDEIGAIVLPILSFTAERGRQFKFLSDMKWISNKLRHIRFARTVNEIFMKRANE